MDQRQLDVVARAAAEACDSGPASTGPDVLTLDGVQFPEPAPSNTRVYVTARASQCLPLGFSKGPQVKPEPPPAVHPGEGFVRLACHWLEFVASDLDQAKRLVRKFLPGTWSWYDNPRGLNNRDRRLEGPWGIKVCYDNKSDGAGNCYIVLPGQACEVMGNCTFHLLRDVPPADWRRVDLAFDGWQDDHGQDIAPRQLWEGLRDHKDFIRSRVDREKCEWRETGFDGKAQTVYLGSRSADRFQRWYNERGFTRCELVLKGKFAQGFSLELQAGTEVRKLSFGCLRDHVDFTQPGQTANITRAPLQTWWERVVCRWDKVKLSAPQVIHTLDEKHEWLKQSVGATFVAALTACGVDVSGLEQLPIIGDMVRAGCEKFSVRHSQLVESSPGWQPRQVTSEKPKDWHTGKRWSVREFLQQPSVVVGT